jgi:hypothetical protein
MRYVAAMLLCAALAGCSTQSMQADMVRSAMPGGEFDADDYSWVMRFNDTQTLVYAVSVADGTVFANRDGLQIGFDGWDVVLVTGLAGAMGDIRVLKPDEQEAGSRQHRIDGIGDFEVVCEAPERTRAGWLTDCFHEGEQGRVHPMPQRVDLREDGRIKRIEAHLIPSADPMILEPLAD